METLDQYIKYAIDVFNYFYPRLVKIKRPIYLHVNIYSLYDDTIYGQFTFPSQIQIFLCNIINTEKEDNLIKVQIITTIVHELMHSNQNTNDKRYANSSKYADRIEQDVEYETSKYVLENGAEIESIFGVDLTDHLYYMDKCVNAGGNYKERSAAEFIFYALNAVTGWNTKEAIAKMRQYENASVTINDHEKIMVKINGRYTNDISILSDIIFDEAFKYDLYRVKLECYATEDTIGYFIVIREQIHSYNEIFRITE